MSGGPARTLAAGGGEVATLWSWVRKVRTSPVCLAWEHGGVATKGPHGGHLSQSPFWGRDLLVSRVFVSVDHRRRILVGRGRTGRSKETRVSGGRNLEMGR